MQNCVKCDFSYDEELENCPRCEELENAPRPELISVAAMTTEFITERGSSKLVAKLGKLWPQNDDVSFKLITEVERKFKGKNKFHSHLAKDNSSNSTPQLLKRYINSSIDFNKLVQLFMDSLIRAARDIGAYKVSGGNIVFMHYKGHESDDLGRLLAIWVTKKEGFDFDEESLIPRDSTHLNLDALRQAALFDITLFDAVYPKVPSGDTYLKFIKGASTGNFFKAAFGCDEKNIGNVDSIKNLRAAVSDYQEAHNLSNEFFSSATDKVQDLIQRAHKEGKPVSLSSLCNAVDSLINDDSKLKGTFEPFINNLGYQINQHIEPTLSSVKDGLSVELVAGDKSFTAKLLRKQIGPGGSGKLIEYEDGQLTLSIVDEKQKKLLDKLAKANSSDEDE